RRCALPRALRTPHARSFPTRRSSDLVGESLVDVGRQDRLDLTVEFQFHNERIAAVHLGTGQRRQQRGGKGTHRGKNHKTGSGGRDRKSTRLNSSHGSISYAVFCLKKK